MSRMIEDTIIKFLSGQAAEEEALEIMQWKNRNEENKKIFREIEIAYNTSEIVTDPEKFDISAAYSGAQSKLKQGSLALVRVRRLKQLSGYAATALLAISLTWFAHDYLNSGGDPRQTADAIYQSVETPSGAKSLVTLEDGTRVWLNAKSKLVYPARFSGQSREVQLEGEGYFDVAKDQSRPFTVKTSHLAVRVLGTVFNLKSYPEEGLIEATLLEGKITLDRINGGSQEKQLLQLKPNEQATFIKREGFLTEDAARAANIPLSEVNHRSEEHLMVTEHADADAVSAWKDDKLIFKNETFESIAFKLERRYDAKIVFEDESVRNYRFSGVFTEISINEALKALQFTSDFSFEIEHHAIRIRR